MIVRIPYDEEEALKRILRHHGVSLTRKMVADLSELMGWVHETERAKFKLTNADPPPYLLVLLSSMGIFGGEVSDRVTVEEHDASTD